MWRLTYFVPIWIMFMAMKLVVVILGLIITPFLWEYRFRSYEHVIAKHPWIKPWVNPEDWEGGPSSHAQSLPAWWIGRHDGEIGFWMWYLYHAIRNPANGLRSIEWLDLDIIPDLVNYKTNAYMVRYEPKSVRNVRLKTVWYLCWQRGQAGFKLIHIWNDERHLVIKLGWRVEPSDQFDDKPFTMGIEDASFASKFLFYRKG